MRARWADLYLTEGLSYTTFNYTNLGVSSALADISTTSDVQELTEGLMVPLNVTVSVTNTGTVYGTDVVLVFISNPVTPGGVSPPIKGA